MPNAFFSEGTKELAAHIGGAAKSVVKVGAEVATFVKSEATKFAGLKGDVLKDSADGAALLVAIETGNVPAAVAAAEALALDVQKTLADATAVKADANAAGLPV